MIKLIINNVELEVEKNSTVMQACNKAGIEIPHFCYHKRLEIAGNCRMCLVEMQGSPKPIASCAMPVSHGMVIKTNTEIVEKARKGVMEFMLINHPLDCPICDQGGECDLQDQAFKYGSGKNRYSENKRPIKDKNLGPLIKTSMTRCIHCTRCIRFAVDIAGIPEIGAVGRGENMEIVSYMEKSLTSEISGNVIDLCPVGALTSKPYAFKARNWELKHTDSIDIMDALGSNIRIDSRGKEVMRILPRENNEINEEWISDKARFSYDGLKYQRLDTPYIKKNGKLEKVNWQNAISFVVDKIKSIKGDEIAAIGGTDISVEPTFLLKKLLNHIGSDKFDANQFGYKIDISNRGNYLFNTPISEINKSGLCLIIGANPRQVAPVLNAKIGKLVRSGNMHVARIGEKDDQTYNIEELGNQVALIKGLSEGKGEFAEKMKNAKNPMIIVGDSILTRTDGYGILDLVHKIAKKYNVVNHSWNGFNILHNHASMVGSLDIGFYYGKSGTDNILKQTRNGKVKVLYLLSSDDFDLKEIGDNCFVIYQGHHGDNSVNRANVILPEAAYTEQDGIYVNMEGRPQYANAAISPMGDARQSWKIINEIAKNATDSINYNSFEDLREDLRNEYQVFSKMNKLIKSEFVEFNSSSRILKKNIHKINFNYYMTDTISRSSVTMSKCSQRSS